MREKSVEFPHDEIALHFLGNFNQKVFALRLIRLYGQALKRSLERSSSPAKSRGFLCGNLDFERAAGRDGLMTAESVARRPDRHARQITVNTPPSPPIFMTVKGAVFSPFMPGEPMGMPGRLMPVISGRSASSFSIASTGTWPSTT